MPGAYLTTRDRRTAIRLLGVLQDNLESSIDSLVVPGTNDCGEHAPDYERESLRVDRADWRAAEDLIAKLSRGAKKEKV
jgi:hypothetical protein